MHPSLQADIPPAGSASAQLAFRALADPTRREILLHLAQKDLTIAEVASHFPITRGAVKKHLGILEAGQLISVHPRGRERFNHLEAAALQPVSEWLNYFNRFWDEKLSGLQKAIQDHQQTQKDTS